MRKVFVGFIAAVALVGGGAIAFAEEHGSSERTSELKRWMCALQCLDPSERVIEDCDCSDFEWDFDRDWDWDGFRFSDRFRFLTPPSPRRYRRPFDDGPSCFDGGLCPDVYVWDGAPGG